MTEARTSILAALRENRPKGEADLVLEDIAIQYEDPFVSFSAMMKKNGGLVVAMDSAYSAVADFANRCGPDGVLLEGELAVAENAAIWIPFRDEAERARPFLAETLAVIVRRADIVSNMAQAYARIGTGELPGYGVFMAGPSKTADIAQCLVIGAHGPIEFVTYLV